MKTAGHLYSPDLFPRGGLVKDGRRRLTACKGLLDVPRTGIREEIEREGEGGVIDRGGPSHVLNGCREGHGVLFPDEFFCQFPEVFLAWRRRFGIHGFVAPSFNFVDRLTEWILAQSFRNYNPLPVMNKVLIDFILNQPAVKPSTLQRLFP